MAKSTKTATTTATATNLNKEVTPLLKPSEQKKSKTSAEKLAQMAETEKAKAEAKAAKLQDERATQQKHLQNRIEDSTLIISKGLYDAKPFARIKGIEDNAEALAEIKAELKLLNTAYKQNQTDELRTEKRAELMSELNEYKAFLDLENLNEITATKDNKTAIDMIKAEIKRAKADKIATEKANAEKELEALFQDEQIDSEQSLQVLGDNYSLEVLQTGIQQKLETFANTVSAVDESGNAVISNKGLIALLNKSAIEEGVRWIQEGLVGMEIKARIAKKQSLTGLKGDGFVEVLKKMYANGELVGANGKPQHYVTLQNSTNVVERFYKYLVGVPFEQILPKQHYIELKTWAKDQDETTLDKFFADAPAMRDGNPISLEDVRALASQSKGEATLDSATGETVLKDEKLKLSLSVSGFADAVAKAIAEYGSMQAFLEIMLAEKYIAIDVNVSDADLTQDEIDAVLDDTFEATETVTEIDEFDSYEIEDEIEDETESDDEFDSFE